MNKKKNYWLYKKISNIILKDNLTHQILDLFFNKLKIYIIINFKICEINWDEQGQTLINLKKKKKGKQFVRKKNTKQICCGSWTGRPLYFDADYFSEGHLDFYLFIWNLTARIHAWHLQPFYAFSVNNIVHRIITK
jgi:hypothetical protein